jgi:hypothetical protein
VSFASVPVMIDMSPSSPTGAQRNSAGA